MPESATIVPPVPTTDLHHLAEARVTTIATKRAIGRALRDARAQREAYRGGLPAEVESLKALRSSTRQKVRAIYLGRIGCKIDLTALLNQRDAQRRPVWALVDPTQPISGANGGYDDRGYVSVLESRISRGECYRSPVKIPVRAGNGKDFRPTGLPPLPARVREIVTDRKIRRRARFVGVLYQPESWHELRPDPAAVVEWKDRPGEYYALAIWGGDRATIMEFVD